ncbi:PTS sugar transporter subunit IIB [Bombilactobacillus bombi]|uniref:PTS sugar transporter subunit IIB n=1 Tax=Bombilactobacillus bombi TaxID=1303590 RepID=UPI0015E613C6|nr:PTS sugar transporter subunit IIB [Bombilactobacillus bombi]MBA1434957.1 PTS mannose/fructose/sorbose transporter subunit IIB [Bombilactobacillus bombi]
MIKLFRVDHRLLHGQVAVSWFGYTGANCILIANDQVPVDAIRKASIKMAKPSGSKLVIQNINKSIESLNSGITDKYNLMIIVESIHDAYRIIQNLDNRPKVLNIGGTKESQETRILAPAVNTTVNDEKEIQKLIDLEVKVEIQQVPSSPIKAIKESDLKLE